MLKAKYTRKNLLHLIATCNDCNWHCEDYINGQRKTREHANRTGHNVVMELAYDVEYNEQKEIEK